jgi:hypothetical protein
VARIGAVYSAFAGGGKAPVEVSEDLRSWSSR